MELTEFTMYMLILLIIQLYLKPIKMNIASFRYTQIYTHTIFQVISGHIPVVASQPQHSHHFVVGPVVDGCQS